MRPSVGRSESIGPSHNVCTGGKRMFRADRFVPDRARQ